MSTRRSQDGMSLMELVVAMAIFALIAVMGVQSLSGMLRTRDRLVEVDDQTAALGQALGLLRNDLSAAMPMVFFPPDRAPRQSAIRLSGNGTLFSLSVSGQRTLDGGQPGGRIERVEWRLDPASQTLHRRAWPTLIPASGASLSPERNVLQGVTEMRVRSYWSGIGWQEGAAPPFGNVPQGPVDGDSEGAAPEIFSDLIPQAIEITLTTTRNGTLRVLEAF